MSNPYWSSSGRAVTLGFVVTVLAVAVCVFTRLIAPVAGTFLSIALVVLRLIVLRFSRR